MAIYDILPDNDLKDIDIVETLNANGGSVTYFHPSWYSASAMLNWASKYKPVVCSEDFISLSLWQSTYFRGDDGNCGLTIPKYSPSSFKSAVKNGEGAWSYTPPRGCNDYYYEPQRMDDFRGYCPSAYNPIGMMATNGMISNGKVSFAIDSALTGSSDTNLTLADIRIGGLYGTSLAEYYMGVFVWNNSLSFFYTSDTPIGSDADLNIEVPITVEGNYQWIPFLSSKPHTTGYDDATATVISCNKKAQEVTVRTATTLKQVQPTGSWNASNTQVSVGAFLHNTGSSQTTFTDITVELWEINGSVEQKVRSTTYGSSVTVGANSMESIDFPTPISYTRQANCDYYLLGYSNETTESVYGEIEEMATVAFSLYSLR